MSAIETSLKVKSVFADDIRVHLISFESESAAFQSLKQAVSHSYAIDSFRLTANDEENDQITITDSRDFMEIVGNAQKMGVAPKFFVEGVKKGVRAATESEKKSDGITSEEASAEEAHSESVNESEPSSCDLAKTLMNDLVSNAQFRGEFASFLQTFVQTFGQSMAGGADKALVQALSAHDSVYEHPAMQKLAPMFPALAVQMQPMLVMLTAINPELIPTYIEHFAAMGQQQMANGVSMMPPFLHGLFGGMCGANTTDDNQAQSESTSQPQPPPMPFMFPGMFGGAMPPPPINTPQNGASDWAGIPPGLFSSFMAPNGVPRCASGRGCGGRRGGGCQRGRRGGRRGCHPHAPKEKRSTEWAAEIISSEETLLNGACVLPKQVLVKTWSVKNTGNADWNEGIGVQYRGRRFNPMVNGVTFPIDATKAGESATVSVVIETPLAAGRVSSNWRLVNAEGRVFGPRLICAVKVVSEADAGMESDMKLDGATTEAVNSERCPIESNVVGSDEDMVLVDTSKDSKSGVKKEAKLEKRRLKLEAKLSKVEKQLSGLEAVSSSSNDSDSNSSADIHIAVAPATDEKEQPSSSSVLMSDEPALPPTDEEDVPPAIAQDEEETPFEYQSVLDQLLGMGFSDAEVLKSLLVDSNGSLDSVIATLFAA